MVIVVLYINVCNAYYDDPHDSQYFGIEYNRVEYNKPWLHEVLPIISKKATDPEYKISPNYSLCIKPRQSYPLPLEVGFRFWTLTKGKTKHIINVKDPELMTQELRKFIGRKVLTSPIKVDLNKDDGYYSGIVESSAGTYCGELHDYDEWNGVHV